MQQLSFPVNLTFKRVPYCSCGHLHAVFRTHLGDHATCSGRLSLSRDRRLLEEACPKAFRRDGAARAHVENSDFIQQSPTDIVNEAAREPACATPAFASISRFLLIAQPQNLLRNIAQRKWPTVSGPVSLLLFLVGLVAAAMVAIRAALVRRVKNCTGCKGYGIVRCQLCNGKGSVDWRAKFSYSEMCPLCMKKRFVVCPDCGGYHHRHLFQHSKGPIDMGN